MTATLAPVADVPALRAAVRGAVVTRDDPGYDAARASFNLAVDQRPAVVVEAAGADDVAAAVRFARATGRVVTAQAGGHGVGPSLSGAVLVRTNAMRDLFVDPERAVARLGAGVRWGEVMEAAGPHGLVGTCGSSGDVGVVGFCLNGGVSWFARKTGYGADNVLSVELVTPEGQVVCVDADSDPDLFWALRGGGGSFGIVTAISIRLHRAPELFGGLVAWPVERAGAVMRAWRAVTDTAREETGLTVSVLNVPDMEQAPEPLRGQTFVTVGMVHMGGAAEGAEILAPIRAAGGEPAFDLMRPLTAAEVGTVAMDPTEPLPYAMRGEAVSDLTDAMLDELAAASAHTPLVMLQIRHMGGAIGRPSSAGGAAGPLPGRYLVYGVGATPVAEVAAIVAERFAAVRAALGPLALGRRPLTFTEKGEDLRVVFGEAYDRLAAIKRERDPDGVVAANFTIG